MRSASASAEIPGERVCSLVRARTHLDGVSINSGPQFRLFTRRPRISRRDRHRRCCKIAQPMIPSRSGETTRRATPRCAMPCQLPHFRVIFAATITMQIPYAVHLPLPARKKVITAKTDASRTIIARKMCLVKISRRNISTFPSSVHSLPPKSEFSRGLYAFRHARQRGPLGS